MAGQSIRWSIIAPREPTFRIGRFVPVPELFDHLVGAGEKHRGHVEAEQLSAGTAEQIVERSIRAG